MKYDLYIITDETIAGGLTHAEIAAFLNRSQPAIGARVKKLNENGLLQK